MSVIDNLITDRTQADVNALKRLAVIGWANMITEERQTWLNDSKGAYNASDANRVGEATNYVAEELNGTQAALDAYRDERGVAPDEIFNVPWDVLPTDAREDWAENEIPTEINLAEYLQAVRDVTGAIEIPGTLPDSMDGLSYAGANAIEKALKDEHELAQDFESKKKELIDLAVKSWWISGEILSGEA